MLYYLLLQYTSTSETIDGVISVLNVLKSAFEQNTRSFFISDLFIQPGQHKTVISEDLSTDMVELYRVRGIFATEEPIRKTVQKLVKLNPKLLSPCIVPLLIARCFQNI